MERRLPSWKTARPTTTRRKGNLPSGSFIALGSRPQGSESALSAKPDNSTVGPSAAKKPNRDVDVSRSRDDPIVTAGVSIQLASLDIFNKVKANSITADVAEKLLLGIVRKVHENLRACPDPLISTLICIISRQYPDIFCKAQVVDALITLLRCPIGNKNTAEATCNLRCLICKILMEALRSQSPWPDASLKAFLEDSLGERSWVDRDECKLFVRNVTTAFETTLPSEDAWKVLTGLEDEVPNRELVESLFGRATQDKSASGDSAVSNRFQGRSEQIRMITMDAFREWWTRRPDTVPKRVFYTLATCCGLSDVRLAVSQKLDSWLQNGRAPWATLWLFYTTVTNCSDLGAVSQDVINNICRSRFKSKAWLGHAFSLAIRDNFLINKARLSALLTISLRNELLSNRTNGYLSIIGQCFQNSLETSTRIFASSMADHLASKEDGYRPVKMLCRDIIRGTLKSDFPLPVFCETFFAEISDELKPAFKERIYRVVEEFFALITFLRIPMPKEGFSSVKNDAAVMAPVHKDIRESLHLAVMWLKNIAPRTFQPSKEEFMQSFQRLLFLDKPDFYVARDGMPNEAERTILLRVVAESGVIEKTLIELLTPNQSGGMLISVPFSIDLVDQLIRRSSFNPFNGKVNVNVDKGLVNTLLKACIYYPPETISLPPNFTPSVMAITALYWKVWLMLILLASSNPQSVGATLWNSYPTGRYMMEMAISNDFVYPPSTVVSGEMTVAGIENLEAEAVETERREILELEVHLAAASTKQQITAENSLLLSQLMKYDPRGLARCPPKTILNQFEVASKQLNLRFKFCSSRSPDFLLTIIQRQGASYSLPWLAEIIREHEDPFNLLPVECCCEFLFMHAEHTCQVLDGGEIEFDSLQKPKDFDQYVQRLKQMAISLKKLIAEGASETWPQSRSAIFYFCNRLHAEAFYRTTAIRVLNRLLPKESFASKAERRSKEIPMEIEEQYPWIFHGIVNLQYFKEIESDFADLLLKSLVRETEPPRLIAYLLYLCFLADVVPLNLKCTAISKALHRRTALTISLLSKEGDKWNNCLESVVHAAVLDLFAKFLEESIKNGGGELPENDLGQCIAIDFANGQRLVIHRAVYLMMGLLLIPPCPVTSNAVSSYDFIFSRMLGSNKGVLRYAQGEQPVESLLAVLMKEFLFAGYESIVDKVVELLEVQDIFSCLKCVGLPTHSAQSLLEKLDRLMESESVVSEHLATQFSCVKRFILLHRSSGATAGLISLSKMTLTSSTVDISTSSSKSDQQIPQNVEMESVSSSQSVPTLFTTMLTHHSGEERDESYACLLKLLQSDEFEKLAPIYFDCINNHSARILRDNSVQLSEKSQSHILMILLLLLQLSEKVSKKKVYRLLSVIRPKLKACEAFLSFFLTRMSKKSKQDGEQMMAQQPGGALASSSSLELVPISAGKIVKTAFSKCPTSSRRVLLSALPHSVNLTTCTAVVESALEQYRYELDHTKLLNFIGGLSLSLRLLKGRDSRRSGFVKSDRLARLNYWQVIVMSQYVVDEFLEKLHLYDHATPSDNGHCPSASVEWCPQWEGGREVEFQEKMLEQSRYFASRVLLLLHYCETDHHLKRLVEHLECRLDEPEVEKVCRLMLLEIYFHNPRTGKYFKRVDVKSTVHPMVHCMSNKLDLVLHHLIRSWSLMAKKASNETAVTTVGVVIKRIARDHPTLLIRHFPLMAALLRGTTKLTSAEYCNSTYLLWFTVILALLEQLVPLTFNQHYVSSAMDILNSFFDFAKNYAMRYPRMVCFIDKIFVILNRFYAVDPELATNFLTINSPLLLLMSKRYPELQSMREVMGKLSFPDAGTSEAGGCVTTVKFEGAEQGDSDHWAPLLVRPPSPVYANQVEQIQRRLDAVSQTGDLLTSLQEVDELCKLKPDAFPYFKHVFCKYLLHDNVTVRKLAAYLLTTCINEHPSLVESVVPALFRCLNQSNPAIVRTVGSRLATVCRLCSNDVAGSLISQVALRITDLPDLEGEIISAVSISNLLCLVGLLF